MHEAISARNLSYHYEGADKNAVDSVNIEIARGEFVAILGRNGSGKSTLGKLFNGLYLASQGEVFVSGTQITDENSAYEARKHCGMVFQDPDNQMVATIVEEDVAFGCENLGVAPDEIKRRVQKALETVGMSEYALSAPHMLSGGQKQRAAIAGVLAMQPDIIVFDESTSMLDPSGRRDIFSLAQRLNERGVTIVWITHFMEEAALCQRLYVMDGGRVALQGTPREVFSDAEAVQKLGLDVPDMTALARQLKQNGIDVRSDIITIDEMEVELCRLA
ncbi:MAG: energy-coupling factor transporter ATPase [Clostridia bacterium]|nr:energy-coupling factor transporter ATPase [Clostridia bacterium]